MSEAEISLGEMEQIEYLEWWAAVEKRKAEIQAKAQVILGLLRRHLPAQVLQEADELLSTEYGCECVCDLLQREQKRRTLLADRPEADSEEIESYLDTGIWRSKDELAARRAKRKAMIGRDELPLR